MSSFCHAIRPGAPGKDALTDGGPATLAVETARTRVSAEMTRRRPARRTFIFFDRLDNDAGRIRRPVEKTRTERCRFSRSDAPSDQTLRPHRYLASRRRLPGCRGSLGDALGFEPAFGVDGCLAAVGGCRH